MHVCSYNICRGHTEARRGCQWHARRESRKWKLSVGIGRMEQERVTRRNVSVVTIYTCMKMSHPEHWQQRPTGWAPGLRKVQSSSLHLSAFQKQMQWLTASHSWRTARFKLLFSSVMSQWGDIWTWAPMYAAGGKTLSRSFLKELTN